MRARERLVMKLAWGIFFLGVSGTLIRSAPSLRAAVSMASVRSCADAVQASGPEVVMSLIACVHDALPGLVETSVEPALMSWMLDAKTSAARDSTTLVMRLKSLPVPSSLEISETLGSIALQLAAAASLVGGLSLFLR